MNRPRLLSFAVAAVTCSFGFLAQAGEWPNWRGPHSNSKIADEKYPISWDRESNVRWRTPLPEKGNSSPIVWGYRIFLTQAIEGEAKRQLMCFDRRSGKVLWTKGTVIEDKEPKHNTNTYCASSPVTDGERVYAYHASAGVFCYDMEGNELWKRDLGPQRHDFGGGVSPVLHGDLLYVYHGPGDAAKLYALNKKTGKDVWSFREPKAAATAKREDGFSGSDEGRVGTYSTPIVIREGDREALVMSFPEWVIALDANKGSELWRCGGLNPLVYTSPLHVDGQIVAMGGFKGPALAVKTGGKGDVTETHRVWKTGMTSAKLSTAVEKDGKLYVINMTGIGECMDLKNGEEVGKARIREGKHGGPVWGSSILVGDRIYAVNQRGVTFVMRADPSFEILSANDLGEASNGTPAFSNGEIFIRTEEALWCITPSEGA